MNIQKYKTDELIESLANMMRKFNEKENECNEWSKLAYDLQKKNQILLENQKNLKDSLDKSIKSNEDYKKLIDDIIKDIESHEIIRQIKRNFHDNDKPLNPREDVIQTSLHVIKFIFQEFIEMHNKNQKSLEDYRSLDETNKKINILLKTENEYLKQEISRLRESKKLIEEKVNITNTSIASGNVSIDIANRDIVIEHNQNNNNDNIKHNKLKPKKNLTAIEKAEIKHMTSPLKIECFLKKKKNHNNNFENIYSKNHQILFDDNNTQYAFTNYAFKEGDNDQINKVNLTVTYTKKESITELNENINDGLCTIGISNEVSNVRHDNDINYDKNMTLKQIQASYGSQNLEFGNPERNDKRPNNMGILDKNTIIAKEIDHNNNKSMSIDHKLNRRQDLEKNKTALEQRMYELQKKLKESKRRACEA